VGLSGSGVWLHSVFIGYRSLWRRREGAQVARFMTGVAFAFFANDTTGGNLAPGRAPFSPEQSAPWVENSLFYRRFKLCERSEITTFTD